MKLRDVGKIAGLVVPVVIEQPHLLTALARHVRVTVQKHDVGPHALIGIRTARCVVETPKAHFHIDFKELLGVLDSCPEQFFVGMLVLGAFKHVRSRHEVLAVDAMFSKSSSVRAERDKHPVAYKSHRVNSLNMCKYRQRARTVMNLVRCVSGGRDSVGLLPIERVEQIPKKNTPTFAGNSSSNSSASFILLHWEGRKQSHQQSRLLKVLDFSIEIILSRMAEHDLGPAADTKPPDPEPVESFNERWTTVQHSCPREK